MEKLLSYLDENQRRCVETTDGPIMLLAGPGTGKTHTLAIRAARLLHKGICRPDNLLILTYSRRSAQDIENRIKVISKSSRACKGATITTFHEASVNFLQNHLDWWDPVRFCPAHSHRGTNFSLCDKRHSLDILKDLLPNSGVEERSYEVLAQIREAKARLIDQPILPGTESPLEALALKFRAELMEQRLLDRDDLLLSTAIMWEKLPDLNEVMRKRYRYIFVDDYQDVLPLQVRWLKLLAGPDPKLFVTGDPDQAIYRTQSSNVDVKSQLPELDLFQEFQRTYPSAHTLTLQQSYRSSGTLLRASSTLISNNESPHTRHIWTESEEGSPIQVMEVLDGKSEANLIPCLVEKAIDSAAKDTLSFKDFAVLYRTPALASPVELAFRKSGIPVQTIKSSSFFDRSEIRDIVAYLSIIANPMDYSSFLRVLKVPYRGLDKRTAQAIMRHSKSKNIPPLKSLRDLVESSFLPKSSLAAAQDFLSAIAQCQEFIETRPLDEAFEKLFDLSGLATSLERASNATRRRTSIKELRRRLRRYAHLSPPEGLQAFLRNAALSKSSDDFDRRVDAVSLLSFHEAKGLEWPVVFIIGAEEEFFPLMQEGKTSTPAWIHASPANGCVSPASRCVTSVHGYASQVNECAKSGDRAKKLLFERRLFYVALTRAREQVWITHCKERQLWGQMEKRHLSPFVRELPEDTLDFTIPNDLLRFTCPQQKALHARSIPGQLKLF